MKTEKKNEWTEWLNQATTQQFLKYLKDSAAEESTDLANSILNGAVYSEKEQTHIATLCMTLINIAEIDYEEIEDFYNKEN